MALACKAVLTSRIKGHHAYNHDYFVGEELICELEFTNKYSHNSIEVKSKNKDVQSVTFLKPWQLFYFHFVKRGKFMKFKQKSPGNHDVCQKRLRFLEEE